MEKIVELGKLYDRYSGLLTDRQRSILSQVVDEDCSLAEIAEREKISRQAVRDAIGKAEHQLIRYEKELHLSEIHTQISRMTDRLADICRSNDLSVTEREEALSILEQIKELSI